ncbi:GNAT family N-acetyltransferase [Kandleria vitulina]|uniref:GNAT family N-acetyltransferase n=1 Tax=Kandleria vitulina TaxID=1630 RepID=UPI000490DF7D|nr:GNAT family N-acetyltransferase [Kandleria vitulina]
MNYRKATIQDLPSICTLIEDAKTLMRKQGIYQWNEYYPHKNDFEEDIKNNNLYLAEEDELLAVYSINEECDEDYNQFKWSTDHYCVLHRLCVSPNRQGNGIGKTVLSQIEKQAKDMGYDAIRLDVFSLNPYARRLYEKNGFIKRGHAHWHMGEFYLMEKILK